MAVPDRLATAGADAGLAEIAALAGVSWQTVFYAFGNRPGVLTVMVRTKRAGRLAPTPCPRRTSRGH